MKCINFEEYDLILELNEEQKRHVESCVKCREKWEALFPDRLIATTFDPAAEPAVDLSDKPDPSTIITDEFLREVEAAQQEGKKARFNRFVSEMFPANSKIIEKFESVLERIVSGLPETPETYQRVASAMSMFPEEEIKEMDDSELSRRIVKLLDAQVGENEVNH